jgi:putative phage-type endonuclease
MILTQRKIQGKSINLQQCTDEWREYRKSKICASDAPIIMGMSPWRTREQLLQEKIGQIESQPINSAMQRGMILEPKARSVAEDMLGTLFLPEVLESIEYPWMCASYDGICIDNKLILEIKCTNKKNHEMAKNGKIPDYYYPQVQHQIAVCDIDCCHYFSFDGSTGVVVVVKRDDQFIKRMIEVEHEFYQELMNIA